MEITTKNKEVYLVQNPVLYVKSTDVSVVLFKIFRVFFFHQVLLNKIYD